MTVIRVLRSGLANESLRRPAAAAARSSPATLAWQVDREGVKGGNLRAGEEKQPGFDTLMVAPERPGTYGRVTVRGRAVFVPGSKGFPDAKSNPWNWPSRGGHKKDPTYILPSTRDPRQMQEFNQHGDSATDHWMVYEWDTRHPDPRQHTHRRSGGLGVPPPALPPVR